MKKFTHDSHDHHGHSHGNHDHEHHHHDHSRLPDKMNRAFVLGIFMNVMFVIVEFTFGIISGSMALLADAGHNLSDVLGLLLAWGAMHLARRAPRGRFTYGFKRSTILAALSNAVLLLVAVGGIAWEAIERIGNPAPVSGGTIIAVAATGVVINALTAFLFTSGRENDINVRGAWLHMVADALVSLGVVVTGALVLWTGWAWLDAAVSLAIAAVIVWSTWGLLRSSVELSLDAVPAAIDRTAVENFLKTLPGVEDVHHLHIWGVSTTEVALTVHLVVPAGQVSDEFFEGIQQALKSQFGIEHTTIQLERTVSSHCNACSAAL